MCWWTDFGLHVKDINTLRNLAVLMAQQYKIITKHDLMSISDEMKTPIPHSINHDDRPKFVAVIATILGDDTTTKYTASVDIAKRLSEIKVEDKSDGKWTMLAKSIILSSEEIAREKKDKHYTMPDETARLVKQFAIVYTNAVITYIEKGPVGLFTIDYVLAELG